MATVRVRDIQNNQVRELPGTTPILWIPYDLGDAIGPCIYDPDTQTVTYRNKSGEHLARVRPGRLEDTHPGEYVLTRYNDPEDPEGKRWWVSEVQAVGGDDVTEP